MIRAPIAWAEWPDMRVFSTAHDVSRFAQMLLRRGELDGVRVLQEDTVARMLEPKRAGAVKRTLGFEVESPYAHGRGQLFRSAQSAMAATRAPRSGWIPSKTCSW